MMSAPETPTPAGSCLFMTIKIRDGRFDRRFDQGSIEGSIEGSISMSDMSWQAILTFCISRTGAGLWQRCGRAIKAMRSAIIVQRSVMAFCRPPAVLAVAFAKLRAVEVLGRSGSFFFTGACRRRHAEGSRSPRAAHRPPALAVGHASDIKKTRPALGGHGDAAALSVEVHRALAVAELAGVWDPLTALLPTFWFSSRHELVCCRRKLKCFPAGTCART